MMPLKAVTRRQSKMAEIFLLVFFLTLSLHSQAAGQAWPGTTDCSPCLCQIQRSDELRLRIAKVADCSRKQLDRIPQLPFDIDQLILTDNIIGDLQDNEFNEYTNLKAIILKNNHLKDLPLNLFQNTTLLQYLDLTGNKLDYLTGDLFWNLEFFAVLKGANVAQFSPDIFHGLAKLRTLDIGTDQRNLPGDFFDGLSLHRLRLQLPNARSLPKRLLQSGEVTLQEVKIVAPKLLSLDEEMFDNLTLLQRVSIDADSMWTLPEHLLHGTKIGNSDSGSQSAQKDDADSVYRELMSVLMNNRLSLKEVEISGVAKIPPKLFQNLPNLEKLSLRKARELDSSMFQTLSRLDSLDLSQNNFSTLNKFWFKNLQGLKALNLSRNQLPSISDSDLADLYSLESLDLSYNPITKLHRESFRSFRTTLEHLDMSWINTCRFSPEMFTEMWALRVLKLNNNQGQCIKNIPANLFHGLENLQEIHLQGNRITNLSPSQFTGQPDLAFLNMSGNALRSLPDNLFKDTALLTVLDLSHNEIGVLPDLLLDRKDNTLLKTVLAQGNPISCDCGVVQLLWLAHKPDVTIEAKCSTPQALKGQRVTALPVSTVCQHSAFLSQFGDLSLIENPVSPLEPVPQNNPIELAGAETLTEDPTIHLSAAKVRNTDSDSVFDSAWFQGTVGGMICGTAVVGAGITVKKLRGHLYSRTYVVNKV